MASIDLRLELPDRLAREAEQVGLLSPRALAKLLRDEMRRMAAARLRQGAGRAAASGAEPMSMAELQREVASVRKARKADIAGA